MRQLAQLAVLYVEDEPLARWTGAKIIAPLVARLTAVAGCGEAVAAARRENFDLVLTDYRLEDGLAADLVKQLRAAGCGAPIFCLTGEAEQVAHEEKNMFAAILPKPLDVEALQRAWQELAAADQNLPDAVPAAAARALPAEVCLRREVLPLWLAPDWELSGNNDELSPFAAFAPTRKSGGLWVLLMESLSPHAAETQTAMALGVLFRELTAALPSAVTPERLLGHCRHALQRFLSPDYEWGLAVLRLLDGRVMYARDVFFRHWRVWLQEADQQWRLLTDWSDGGHWRPVAACLFMDLAACQALSARRPGVNLAALGAAAASLFTPGPPPVLAGNCFYCRARAAARRIAFSAGCLQTPEKAASALRRLEASLLLAELPALPVRRLCCALLDVGAALPPEAAIAVEWDDVAVSAVVAGGEHAGCLAENRFFDAVVSADGMTRAAVHLSAAPEQPVLAARPLENAPTGGALSAPAHFEVLPLETALTREAAARLAARMAEKARLAMDAGGLRFFAWSALALLREAAEAARRRDKTGESLFCLVSCTPLVERLLRQIGMERDLDLVPDFAALDAMARRMTSASERASLLESVVVTC